MPQEAVHSHLACPSQSVPFQHRTATDVLPYTKPGGVTVHCALESRGAQLASVTAVPLDHIKKNGKMPKVLFDNRVIHEVIKLPTKVSTSQQEQIHASLEKAARATTCRPRRWLRVSIRSSS
ncbi:hypothetical protein Vretimale_642 [Volvox reticuliferus]|uniref:Uncharacterized protein n=1 Tax=Volvox reticuliferus TaxID=1737510 RepID=A0A8J4FXK1_9CHLO|nr:hypothetical protein Vretimale_642 [Volvox reticuliferus]